MCRFWILAAHSEQNLLAAGHDSGMIVFKLERERPAYDIYNGRMFYVKDKYLRMHEFGTQRDVPVVSVRRGGHSQPSGLGNGPRSLSYNSLDQSGSSVLICSVSHGRVCIVTLLFVLLSNLCCEAHPPPPLPAPLTSAFL